MTKKPVKQQNHFKDLALLFSVPLGIAVLAAAIIYVPRYLANPSYDFVYSVCNSYECDNDFDVDSQGRVVESKKEYTVDESAKLYIFSTKDDASKKLTLEQARQYKLNTSSKSPDNYRLTGTSDSAGFLFWEADSDWYLSDGLKKKKLDVPTVNIYDTTSINFLGWVNK